MRKFINYSILFLLILSATASFAQDKAALEKKRKQLEKDINYTQTQLQKTEATKKASLSELETLDKQIKLRKELIDNTSQEVTVYSKQINQTAKSLSQLQNELEKLRKEYARSVYVSYKEVRFTDKFFFIASAKTFSESVRRINYLRKISDVRKKQVAAITATQQQITQQLNDIQHKKLTKEQLLNQQVKQQKALNKNKTQKVQLVKQLNKKEKDLKNKLIAKQKEANKLNSQIEAIIAKEIIKNTPEPVKPGTSQSKPSISSTPVVDKLSASFVSNKGRLPWPVDKGFISRSFGHYRNEEIGVDFDNTGVDIRTDANASVKAVFDGKVIAIISNPTYKNAVIISHGDYYTVYSKLESVSVSKGQTVNAKQVIGRVFTDTETGDSDVHFEVWKGQTKMNPSGWIAPK